MSNVDEAIAAARALARALGEETFGLLTGIGSFRRDPADSPYQAGYRDALLTVVGDHIAPLVPLHDRLREALARMDVS